MLGGVAVAMAVVGVVRMVSRPAGVPEAALTAHKHAGRVRHLYGVAMAALLSGDVDATVLKRRELLRRLDADLVGHIL